MALKLNERYPGRFNSPTAQYPQGSFKNRTAPGAKDGSYLEQDWANDNLAFYSSLLSGANITANGSVDTVGASQYYDALLLNTQRGVIGTSRNVKMSVTASSTTATLTANEVIVQTALGGLQYKLSSFSKTINLATTGAGGMDTGTVPATGFVALYAIYNPTTQVSALLAVNTTSVLAPEVYGGANMPSGYTASALVSVWRTAASKFVIGYQAGRSISIQNTVILSVTSNVTTPTIVSISSVVPVNANRVSGIGNIVITTAVGGNYSELNLFVDGNDVGTQRVRYAAPTIGEISSNYDLQMSSQSIYYTTLSFGGAIRSTVYISKYEF